MPRNTELVIGRKVQQLTDANVEAITFQNTGNTPVFVAVTADASAPTWGEGVWLMYNPGQGESNKALADLMPGVTGARVWAYSSFGARMAVSHA